MIYLKLRQSGELVKHKRVERLDWATTICVSADDSQQTLSPEHRTLIDGEQRQVVRNVGETQFIVAGEQEAVC